jgi:HEAT repeat protein
MMQQRNLEQQVRAALANDDRMARMQSIVRLRDTHRSETLAVLVQALDDPDERIHSRAGSALALFHEAVGEVAPKLAAHLKTSPYPGVRLPCAIVLMSTKTPVVHEAYLHALRDSFDKVVMIACIQVADFGGEEDAEALYAILEHPLWRVRLEGCKALITMKKADSRVVSTLEEMRKDPEATRYDAEVEEFDRNERNAGVAGEFGETWGKLETILQQAQRNAASG